jgi:hypothetical protein
VTIATANGGRQRSATDSRSQATHAAALAVPTGTWLRDEEASGSPRSTRHSATRCPLRCRIEPYWIKAAPLRSAAARRCAGLCLGAARRTRGQHAHQATGSVISFAITSAKPLPHSASLFRPLARSHPAPKASTSGSARPLSCRRNEQTRLWHQLYEDEDSAPFQTDYSPEKGRVYSSAPQRPQVVN